VATIHAAATSSNMNLFYHLTAATSTWLIECSLASIWFV